MGGKVVQVGQVQFLLLFFFFVVEDVFVIRGESFFFFGFCFGGVSGGWERNLAGGDLGFVFGDNGKSMDWGGIRLRIKWDYLGR